MTTAPTTYWWIELLRVLVWPLVLVGVLLWLRKPIKERIGDVEQFEALGMRVQLANRRLVNGVSRVFGRRRGQQPSGSGTPEGAAVMESELAAAPEPDTTRTQETGTATAPETPDEPVARLSQQDAEELIEAAAQWGQARGAAGLPTDGVRIEWDGDRPQLITPAVPNHYAPSSHLQSHRLDEASRTTNRVARLEALVERLDRQRRPVGYLTTEDIISGQSEVIERQYRDAQRRLRLEDPDSPLLD